jgi:phosphopantothenoylcysteine decarboxylase/phosphopantothenate--cysteine ligase
MEKGVDLVVWNRAEEAIGSETNRVVLIDREGEQALPELSKSEVARRILAEVARRLPGGTGGDGNDKES